MGTLEHSKNSSIATKFVYNEAKQRIEKGISFHEAIEEAKMKLATFEIGNENRIGLIEGGKIVDLTLAYASYLKEVKSDTRALRTAKAIIPPNMLDLLDKGEKAMNEAKKAYDFAVEKIEKGKEFNVSGKRVVYELNKVKQDENPFSIVGYEEDVIWPSYSQILDYELEFAICNGQRRDLVGSEHIGHVLEDPRSDFAPFERPNSLRTFLLSGTHGKGCRLHLGRL